ncbi:MAG: hypothetical protein HY898_24160 [Deltaproteobacteria bacterium]|nr:hypothetical protein [Deltaproteobacteria bacterium]
MRKLLRLLPVAALLSACSGSSPAPVESTPAVEDDFDSFVDGKADTGYVSARAAELEATITAKVRVRLAGKTPEELQTLADTLKSNPGDYSLWSITQNVTEQIKYARNTLKAQKYDLNLEGGTPTFTAVDVIDQGLDLSYSVKLESLVKFKELADAGVKVADLVGKTVDIVLPLEPAGLFERITATCAKDPDGDPLDAAELNADNLFYYWSPTETTCPLKAEDLVTARYEVKSSVDTPTVFPEYDKLIADGKISMVAIFGQIEHGTLTEEDWGFISFDQFTSNLRQRGFAVEEEFADNMGHRLGRTYASGLKVTIDMYTPVGFGDAVPKESSQQRFREAIRNHEIVYYGGHAFYGSLDVLDDPAAYPPDTYQIIFMDACWSYAYYTKQVFRHKATATDPTGWELVDVVNNTEMGNTGSEGVTSVALFGNIFKGATAVKANQSAAKYSWNNLIEYMNVSSDKLASEDPTGETKPEIYGASGVRTNKFKPAH